MSSFNSNFENDDDDLKNSSVVDDGDETSGDEFSFDDGMFDNDGNFIMDSENDEVETEDDVNGSGTTTEVDVQKTVQEEEPVASETTKPSQKSEPPKKKSPEETKIINLKRELQALQREKAEMQKSLDEQNRKKEKDALIARYVDNGIDEETAKLTADSEMRTRQLEEKLELLEFKEQNDTILSKYANAKNDISTIVKNAKLTGMTVEQICRGMYGEPDTMSDYERRAIAAVKGNDTMEVSKGSSVASAERTSTQPVNIVLSQEELRKKRFLEQMKGEKLTNDEIKKYFNK